MNIANGINESYLDNENGLNETAELEAGIPTNQANSNVNSFIGTADATQIIQRNN